jgi:beta-galactosidase
VVYLNGARIGEHDPCFSAASFDVTRAIHWGTSNELIIRIGAHPGVLPANVSQGTDFEKNRWTPGIYDDVTLSVMDNPVITNVQVAPQLASSSILVQTELHNYADQTILTTVRQKVFQRTSHEAASLEIKTQAEVPADTTMTVQQTIPMKDVRLWRPEDPFLYTVTTSTEGDETNTRFGMREFRFDTATQRAYLNGRPYFLRGSNITLHRFFEDPEVGTLPWNEAWLHRLLVEIPKQLHWNAFRFCIGPVPDRWLEIADENGLLIQNEYMVWTGHSRGVYHDSYDTAEMIVEYREWMRDNWNHPSVAIWDATRGCYGF